MEEIELDTLQNKAILFDKGDFSLEIEFSAQLTIDTYMTQA